MSQRWQRGMLAAETREPIDDGPSRCPWCGKHAVREQGVILAAPVRYFHCDACGRTFKIALVLIDEPKPAANDEER